ncbi:MAG: hypothetical protein GY711_17375 [bacterium]|nr:hypothetical protein [bacterium]
MLRPLFALSIVIAIVGSSCQELPHQTGTRVQVLEHGRIEELNPNDIAVPPIILSQEGLRVPEELRAAFQRGLVKRRYTPLSLEYVDSSVIEASYDPGRLQEDAVCQVTVHDWDSTLWDARTALFVDIEMRMIDPEAPDGPALFAARLPGRFDFGGDSHRYANDNARLRAACDHLVEEILSAMPARRTGPGRL